MPSQRSLAPDDEVMTYVCVCVCIYHTSNHARMARHVGCSMLLCVAACCSVLQCVAGVTRAFLTAWLVTSVAACCSMLQHFAACCSMLQHVAMCCRSQTSITIRMASHIYLHVFRALLGMYVCLFWQKRHTAICKYGSFGMYVLFWNVCWHVCRACGSSHLQSYL